MSIFKLKLQKRRQSSCGVRRRRVLVRLRRLVQQGACSDEAGAVRLHAEVHSARLQGTTHSSR